MASYTAGHASNDPTTNRPPADVDPAGGRRLLGHPPGLFLLFFVEMWERFSYYGMRGLLVLYLIKELQPGPDPGLFSKEIVNPGRGWTEEQANTLYGWYTGLAYLFPVLGGIIADKFIGTHRSMVLGGLLIALGHIVLAASGYGELASNQAGLATFIGGLALIVLGTGHFKPCVSTMVGQLYKQGDPARDGGFSIFYMGINLGAFLCAFVCGTLGQQVGWHWGFGSAAVGMIAGLIMYMFGRPMLLQGIGLPPPNKSNISVLLFLASCALAALFGYAYFQGAFGWVGDQIAAMNAQNLFQIGGTADAPTYCTLAHLIAAVGGLAVFVACAWFVAIQGPGDKGPTASIFLFMLFNAFFWIAFEQAGSSMNVFAEKSTDRHLFGYEFPATWFQSVNAGLIFIFAPFFAWMWGFLGRRNMNPTQPMKISFGLILLGLGFVFMVQGAMGNKDGTLVSPWWLFMAYFWHTMGELCLSPTGLSYVTKAAPVRFVSLLMGVWFISSFIANLGGGLIAAKVEAIERGDIKTPWHLGGRADFFMLFVVSSIGVGVLVMLFTPLLKKLLRSKSD
jgi:POT family proton-dependent oligopeptide transporter